jgi:antitoxin CcdA
MKHAPDPRQTRRKTSLSVDPELIEAARALDINLSRAAETGIAAAVAAARAARWRAENAGAIASSNAWVEANGLPLARWRRF